MVRLLFVVLLLRSCHIVVAKTGDGASSSLDSLNYHSIGHAHARLRRTAVKDMNATFNDYSTDNSTYPEVGDMEFLSPQYKAEMWQQADPNLAAYSENRLKQRLALAVLYFATSGPSNWTNSSGWLDYQVNECDWFTSSKNNTCDDNGLYVSLDLSSNELSGYLPISDLVQLPRLEHLNLADNYLTGSLPSDLGQMTDLVSLQLDSNHLTGPIPTEIGLATRLSYFVVYGNNINSTLPAELGNVTSLIDILVRGNQITGTIPSELALITGLQLLPPSTTSVSRNRDGILDRVRRDLQASNDTDLSAGLERLWLDGNPITGTIPTELASLASSLVSFTFNETLLTGTVPSGLCSVQQLTSVDACLPNSTTVCGCVGPLRPAPLSTPPPPLVEGVGCAEAAPLQLGSITSGSTVGGVNENVAECFDADAQEAPGVWYYVHGTGNTLVITTCFEDEALGLGFEGQFHMSVWEGACGGNFTCITGEDDNDNGDVSCDDGVVVRWDSSPDVFYYVLVYGEGDETGSFHLKAQELGCPSAMGPLPLDVVTSGSTVEGYNERTEACGNADEQDLPGVWYTVRGTGNTMLVTTCTGADDTDFDTEISIWTGGCNALGCVGGSKYGMLGCNDKPSVVWPSIQDQDYFVLVYGSDESDDDAGSFELLVMDDPDLLELGCSGATQLRVGETREDTTAIGHNANVGACGSAMAQNAPGLWYTVKGTGNEMMVAVCSDIDIQISMWTGICGDGLQCFPDGISNENNNCVEIQWSSLLDEDYYISVYGKDGNTGSFTIKMEELGCHTAVELDRGDSVEGSTERGHNDGMGSCGGASEQLSPGVWYKVEGTGNNMIATTCFGDSDNEPDIDLQISVWRGTCGETLNCVAGNDDDPNDACGGNAPSVRWSSDDGQDYYILVYGKDGNTGSFTINVEELGCHTASELDIGDTEGDTTARGYNDGMGSCGGASAQSAPGVWYYVEGTGNEMFATTCFEDTSNGIDTQISVWKGSCNDGLTCVDGNDNINSGGNCGSDSEVAWSSEDGEDYYILVHGRGGEVGSYDIKVDELCPNMDRLEVGQTTYGSTDGEDDDGMEACGTATAQNTPGVWYLVRGTGRTMGVTTCTGNAAFDTQVSVWEGDCDSPSCVDGNDDSIGCVPNGDPSSCCSTVEWPTDEDKYYYVLVYGYSGTSGTFEINIFNK